MDRRMNFHAVRQINSLGIGLYIFQNTGSARGFAKQLEFEVVADGRYVDPTVSITADEAQQIVDELWACGIRPSEGTGSAGSLAATEKHLKDMQRIVFGTLELKHSS